MVSDDYRTVEMTIRLKYATPFDYKSSGQTHLLPALRAALEEFMDYPDAYKRYSASPMSPITSEKSGQTLKEGDGLTEESTMAGYSVVVGEDVRVDITIKTVREL